MGINRKKSELLYEQKTSFDFFNMPKKGAKPDIEPKMTLNDL